MGKTHIQRKLEKIQQHGIEYRVFDLEGNVGQQTRRFRFEEDVYRALLNNPAVAGEVIVLTQTALQHKNKAQQELFQVLIKKIFAKDALHTSAQAEFELYYESDFFRKLSHETLERYANMHFLPKYALGERSGYVEYIINAIIEHVKEREHEVWGAIIKPVTNQPERFPKENLINDSKDIDTNMLKILMERNIKLHAQDDSDLEEEENDIYNTERIEVEFFLYLLSNTRYFTFDLQKAIDSFTWEKYDLMMKTHSIPADMYVYIGDDWENAYSKRSIL